MRWTGALAWALLASTAVASPAKTEDKTLSPYFFVEGGDESIDRLPLDKTQVQVKVEGVIAAVTVRQRYQNRGTRPISAQYIFPASTRAAVNGMRMTVGDRIIEAQLQKRQEARQTFETAKREGKSASLLEQDRANVFRMKVANILPGEEIAVELRYTELLVPTDGIYELVYPTVVGPRYSTQSSLTASDHDRFVQSPYLHAGDAPTSTFELTGELVSPLPLQELGSASHKVQVEWRGPSRAGIALHASEKWGGNRDFILRYRLVGSKVQSGLMLSETGGEKFFLLMVEPPARVTPAMIPPREYIFILDVSGSMYGFPLETAKVAMRELFKGLRPQDLFNVLLFSGGSELLWPSSAPATPQNVQSAMTMIDSQRGGGGTELLEAMKRAMNLPRVEKLSRSLVIATDGYIGEDHAVPRYVREHLGDANVFSFGIGTSVNRALIEGIAKAGMGEPFVITRPEEAAAEVQHFVEYVSAPVLTRVKLQSDGVELDGVTPSSIPDVLSQRPVVIHGKWRGDRKGSLRLTGVGGAGPYSASFSLSQTPVERGDSPLRYLWARTRIAELSDEPSASQGEAAEEITRLGLTYQLLTQHTSFVAVHDVRRTAVAATDVSQPLPMPQGVSNLAVGESGVAVGAEPELWLLMVLAASLMAFTLLWQRRTA